MNTLLLTYFVFTTIGLIQGSEKVLIDVFNQKYGDIYSLRPVFYDPSSTVLHNALKSTSTNKWDVYKNEAGKYIVPYVVQGKYTPQEKRVIRKAMNSIERNTCLKFQRRQKESDYLTIQNKANEGCYSLVGRDKGPQVLMLESSNVATCIAYQIVVHELLHVSGLWHEQMRSDRDSYLKINYNNIDSWSYPQFAKVSASEATTYNVPYDYKSIMHYDKTAFAKRAGLITMQTKDKSMQDVIGKMSDVSKYDYFKVCSIYNCKTCMNDNNWKNLLKKKKKVKGQDGEEFDINQDLTSTTKEVISNLNEGISPKVTTIPPVNVTKLIIPNQDKETCGDLFPNVCRSLLGDSESPKTICKMFGPVLDSWCCKSCKVAIN